MNKTLCFPTMVCAASLCGVMVSVAMVFAGDAPKNYKPTDFSGPVFQEQNGFVVVEAESVPLSSKWSKRTDAPGNNSGGCGEASSLKYTGSGYMRWDGPALYCASQGKPEGDNHADITQGCQGSKSDWMVIKIQTSNPGNYTMKARTYHLLRDGDNDWWGGWIGMTGTIERNANCHIKNYSWPDFTGSHAVTLVSGLNAVFISGRSKGIGIDRVAIYKGSAAGVSALNTAVPESKQVSSTELSQIISRTQSSADRLTVQHGAGGITLLQRGEPVKSATIYSLQGSPIAHVSGGWVVGSLPIASRMVVASVETADGQSRQVISLAR